MCNEMSLIHDAYDERATEYYSLCFSVGLGVFVELELLNGETSDVRLMPKCLISRVILIHHDYVRTHASRESSLRECLSAFQPS
jgi:hypothetical protein